MREWIIEKPEASLVRYLSERLEVSEISGKLLVNRGIIDPDDAEKFLYPSLSSMENPFQMADMEKAVERTIRAFKNKESIVIYGDYDADGITSTAILNLFFDEIGIKTCYYIPHREREGYGIHADVIKCFHSLGVKLMISVDCGTTNIEEIAFAKEKGIDTIVLDHHEVRDEYPPSSAFVNPKRKDCSYPFKELAGVGVVFNFLVALRSRLRDMGITTLPNLKNLLDLVAIGTLADAVPLLDQNRIYVKYGIELIKKGERPGIKALKEVSGLGKDVTTFNIIYQLIPRINVAGRLGSARKGVELLTTPSYEEASEIAKWLNQKNSERQNIEEKIMEEIKSTISSDGDLLNKKMLIFKGENWHPGVIGIVASRLVDEYGRPAIVFTMRNGKLIGSGRSIEEVNLYELIRRCDLYLERYGGHRMAAGLSLKPENFEALSLSMEREIEDMLGEIPKPRIRIDAALPLSNIDFDFISREYELFSPFGPKNPKPVFATDKVIVRGWENFGRNNIKLRVEEGGRSFSVFGFRWGEPPIPIPSKCRLAYSFSISEYMGERYLQIELEDIKLA